MLNVSSQARDAGVERLVGNGLDIEDGRTPLELVHRLFPRETRTLLPKIQSVIVDTNVLLKNIRKDAELFPGATSMQRLRVTGALRLFAPPHVELEMEEKLDQWMADRGVDPALARRIWEQVYRPAIWFVDVGTFAADDPRLVAVRSRDATDAPTAALSILLGRKVLSEDRDLADVGLATGRPWLAMVLATGHVVRGETVESAAVGALGVTSQGLARLAFTVRVLSTTRNGRRLLIVLGLIGSGIVAAGLVLRRLHGPSRQWIDEKARAAAITLKEGGRVVVGGYIQVEHNRRNGEMTLRAGVVASADSLCVVQRAAQILASAPQPLRSNELARRIWGYERAPRAKTEYVRAQLAALPAFDQVEPDAWQLRSSRTVGSPAEGRA